MSGRLTHTIIRALDSAAKLFGATSNRAQHLETGVRGEEAAYFHLRKLGYTMVARNFRSPRRRGEIDLIGWEGDVLCFIEVKTRTSYAVKPAEAAVDLDKQRELRAVADEYLRRLHSAPAFRFDVVSIYYLTTAPAPEITLFKNAFPVN
jgi:putative endonuclease